MLGGYYHTVPSKIKAKIMTSFLADFKGVVPLVKRTRDNLDSRVYRS